MKQLWKPFGVIIFACVVFCAAGNLRQKNNSETKNPGTSGRLDTSAPPQEEAWKTQADPSSLREIYYAGGCFWGVESYFSQIPGVYDVTVGYANGSTENPTYEEVCSHRTGHAETVHVQYDPSCVSLQTLTKHFFKIIDPLSVNRQGNDVGSQYRTGIYYTDEDDLETLKGIMADEQKKYDSPLAVELLPLTCYYLAEEYHQDYLEKNPGGYCHVDFSGLSEFKN